VTMNTRVITLLLPVLLLILACGDDDPAAPGAAQLEIVTGEVVTIDDQTPVDGGITIEIRIDDSETDELYFPSLFTEPPPDNATLDLYDLVRRVEIGDRVRVEGTRNAQALQIDSLWIIQGRI